MTEDTTHPVGGRAIDRAVPAPLARLSDIDPDALLAWTLRSDSPDGRELFARRATGSVLGWAELIDPARSAPPPVGAASDLTRAGYLAALSANDPQALAAAVRLLDLAADTGNGADGPTWSGEISQAYAQALIRTGQVDRALTFAAQSDLNPMVDWAIRLDAAHPALHGGSTEEWLHLLNEPFREHGLEPLEVADPHHPSFAGLFGSATSTVDDPEMVSVVMSVFKPDADILMAARSVLAQSWTNLELLVVDDASPSGEDLLRQVAALDERVRILRSPVNRGTYQARNLALREARGAYLTIHDFDDWTHPRRLERQITAMRADPALLASRSGSFRVYTDLSATYLGYLPQRISATSLLVKVPELKELAGQFDSVRKSADMELPSRLRAIRKGSVLDLPITEPLTVYQLRPNSLSRGDVRPGWTRWTRLAYRDLYSHWHARIKEGKDTGVLAPGLRRPFPMPDPTWAPEQPAAAAPDRVDLLVAGDFRRGQASSDDVLDLVRLATRAGWTVAVADVEAPRPATVARDRGRRELAEFLRTEPATLISLETPVHADLLLVANPGSFELRPGGPIRWTVDRIGALVAPLRASTDQRPLPYAPDACAATLRALFGRHTTWLPQGETLTEAVTVELGDASHVAPLRLLGTQVPPRVRPAAAPPGSHRRPVLGHHLKDGTQTWPIDQHLLEAYPADGSADVRFLHRPARALRSLGLGADPGDHPPHWSIAADKVPVEEFLLSLDYFVALGQTPDLPRQAARALAAGCVAILPPRWEPTFGSAARYAEPGQVSQVVRELEADPAAREAQLTAGCRWLDQAAAATLTSLAGVGSDTSHPPQHVLQADDAEFPS